MSIVDLLPKKDDLILDLAFSDGTILRSVLIAGDGRVVGQIVGGQDGLIPLDETYEVKFLTAVRRRDGLWRNLGLTKWIRFRPQRFRQLSAVTRGENLT